QQDPPPPAPWLTDDVLQLLKSSNPTTCLLDPIPSTLFQSIFKDVLPFYHIHVPCHQ
ncbi:hypothetical protein NFI96_026341, partial [Prochilodus magdalenae]